MRPRRCSVCHVDIPAGTGWAEATQRTMVLIKMDGSRSEHDQWVSYYFCDDHRPE